MAKKSPQQSIQLLPFQPNKKLANVNHILFFQPNKKNGYP
jgi:hypothetical protein